MIPQFKTSSSFPPPVRVGKGEKFPSGWFGQLWDWIFASRPIPDNKTIFGYPTSRGIILSTNPKGGSAGGGSSSSSYSGVFAIIAGENDTYKCVNNALSSAIQDTSPAGIAYIGYLTISVAALLAIQPDSYVWLETSYSEENSTYTTILNSGAEVPEGSQGFNVFYVGFAGDSIDQSLKENYDARWLLL